jgi:hypothetical protein
MEVLRAVMFADIFLSHEDREYFNLYAMEVAKNLGNSAKLK